MEHETCPACGEFHEPGDYDLSPEEFWDMVEDIHEKMDAVLDAADRVAMLAILSARTLADIQPEDRAVARADLIEQTDENTKRCVEEMCGREIQDWTCE